MDWGWDMQICDIFGHQGLPNTKCVSYMSTLSEWVCWSQQHPQALKSGCWGGYYNNSLCDIWLWYSLYQKQTYLIFFYFFYELSWPKITSFAQISDIVSRFWIFTPTVPHVSLSSNNKACFLAESQLRNHVSWSSGSNVFFWWVSRCFLRLSENA